MLQLTAQLADGWNCPFPHELEAGLAALARHGRRRETIAVSAYVVVVPGRTDEDARRAIARVGRAAQLFGDVERYHLWGDAARLRAGINDFARRGADQLVLDIRGVPAIEGVQLLRGAL
jgi:alkanesulfonate monooxygenase SsuD/methylene tetrahydromethanopterin reductase-like flavin-dependent oxidoreductase (luciferase family)